MYFNVVIKLRLCQGEERIKAHKGKPWLTSKTVSADIILLIYCVISGLFQSSGHNHRFYSLMTRTSEVLQLYNAGNCLNLKEKFTGVGNVFSKKCCKKERSALCSICFLQQSK